MNLKKKVLSLMLCLVCLYGFMIPISAKLPTNQNALPDTGRVYEVDCIEDAFAVRYSVESGNLSYYAVEQSKETIIKEVGHKLADPAYSSISNSQNDAEILASDPSKVTDTSPIPYSAIAKLLGDGDMGGTAWMISANAAVTCAHCVYDYTTKQYIQNGKIYPGKKGNFLFSNPFGNAKIKEIYLSPDYIQGASVANNSDWAVIVLDENIGDKCGYLGFKFVPRSMTGMSFTTSGYPESEYYQHQYAGTISDCDDRYIFHSVNATHGQSGSPMYDSSNQVIGIISESFGTHNLGIRIYSQFFDFLLNFR